MSDKRISSKLRGHACDEFAAYMIAKAIGATTWTSSGAKGVPRTLINFIKACQSGTNDFGQLYIGNCWKCGRTISNLTQHICLGGRRR
jgi:hypothetical protein